MSYPFIVIEGIDGSGKTTLRNNLSTLLEKHNIKHIATSEPTQGEIGKIIRQNLLQTNADPSLDALLFAADRVWHWHTIIKPALEKNILVISDRHKISSLAYQSCQGLEIEWIKTINSKVPDPPYTLYLEISPEKAFERIKNKKLKEKFETLEYLKNLRKCYENALKKVNTELYVIDASLEPEKVLEQAVTILQNIDLIRAS